MGVIAMVSSYIQPLGVLMVLSINYSPNTYQALMYR
jgi:hypothetical protein